MGVKWGIIAKIIPLTPPTTQGILEEVDNGYHNRLRLNRI